MSVILSTPNTRELAHLHEVISGWQHDEGPLQLHPGDLGWYGLRGDSATAASMRVWSVDDAVAAIALIDGPQLLRLAIDPVRLVDERLAARIAADVDDPGVGVLDSGEAVVEARGADALGVELDARGWRADEPWTPLHFDLSKRLDVDLDGLRIRTVEPGDTEEWVRVHRSAFRGTPMPEEDLRNFVGGWENVAASPLFGSARILSVENGGGDVVAVAAVWSAGEGRPGLVEPMGVHQDQRGHGYGTAMTRAAAAALRELGASSAIVCAESANLGAIATYLAAGFTARAEVADWLRED